MKTDINDYKIRNHDGVDKTVSNEGKQSFANDDIRSIKENSTAGVRENVRVGETFDDRSKKYSDGSSGNSAKNSSKSGNGDISSSSSSSSSSVTSSATSSVSSAASSAATSAASAIGGSMGAIAGSVAASVMTAVMVVEVFVSTPLEECERRDVKGLYVRARRGEVKDFTGISAPFEAPEHPALSIDTSVLSLEESVNAVVKLIITNQNE